MRGSVKGRKSRGIRGVRGFCNRPLHGPARSWSVSGPLGDRGFSNGEWDPVITGTTQQHDNLDEIAQDFPDQLYITYDDVVEQPNVASITYAQNEGSFLAGVLAGIATTEPDTFDKSDGNKKVGVLGGMDIPVINDFIVGFKKGVESVDPSIEVFEAFVGDFNDPNKGYDQPKAIDDAGRRTMYTDRGANLNLAAEDIGAGLLDVTRLLHLTAYSLFEPQVRTSALAMLDRARAAGVDFSIDPSSVAFLREHGAQQFFEWTAGARLIFPNREEAEFLTGAKDPVAAARVLNEHYPVVIITLDAGGAVVVERGVEPVRVAAKRITAVDPTGAGDSFCAGFLAEWLATEDIVAAAEAGSRTAAVAVTKLGARP